MCLSICLVHESAIPRILRRLDIGRDDRAFPMRGCPVHKGRGDPAVRCAYGTPEADLIECTDNEGSSLPEEAAAVGFDGPRAPLIGTRNLRPAALCALPCSRSAFTLQVILRFN